MDLSNLTVSFQMPNDTGLFAPTTSAPTICDLSLGAKEELLLRYLLLLFTSSILYLLTRRGVFPDSWKPLIYGLVSAVQLGSYAMLFYLLVFVK